jgi:hypothetical protein
MSNAQVAILCTGLGTGMVLLALSGVTRRAAADAPMGWYQTASGEVVDTQTGLVWQQVSSSTGMSWADAQTYCGGAWRLPSMKELQTLVDETRIGPALDATAFADVSSASGYEYWSSTPVAGLPSAAWWFVEFEAGHSTYGDAAKLCRVRCVR